MNLMKGWWTVYQQNNGGGNSYAPELANEFEQRGHSTGLADELPGELTHTYDLGSDAPLDWEATQMHDEEQEHLAKLNRVEALVESLTSHLMHAPDGWKAASLLVSLAVEAGMRKQFAMQAVNRVLCPEGALDGWVAAEALDVAVERVLDAVKPAAA